jgi:hypothetical protein
VWAWQVGGAFDVALYCHHGDIIAELQLAAHVHEETIEDVLEQFL